MRPPRRTRYWTKSALAEVAAKTRELVAYFGGDMAISSADEDKIATLHAGLETQIQDLPEEARLKLFGELIRQYCTRCGKKQPDKDFCKCGLAK